jgi:hypothetical protein
VGNDGAAHYVGAARYNGLLHLLTMLQSGPSRGAVVAVSNANGRSCRVQIWTKWRIRHDSNVLLLPSERGDSVPNGWSAGPSRFERSTCWRFARPSRLMARSIDNVIAPNRPSLHRWLQLKFKIFLVSSQERSPNWPPICAVRRHTSNSFPISSAMRVAR